MIDSERYQRTIEAAQRYSKTHAFSKDHFPILLDQQYRTVLALRNLGVRPDSPPENIPHLNYLFRADMNPENPTFISVIGIPNAFKTTSIAKVADVSDRNIVVVPERYRVIKNQLDASGEFSFERLSEIALKQQSEDDTEASIRAYRSRSRIITIFDRNWTDIPMARAQLVFGMLDLPHLQRLEENFSRRLSVINKFENLMIVIAFIRPETAISRQEEGEGPGRIMQIPFLQTLYEQYLRFYDELINNGDGDKPRDVSFIAVDSTDTQSHALRDSLRTLFPNTEPLF